jgi:hypothetical protein
MISLSHILRMTDDIGIFEHCKFTMPDPAEGYTTDDNARALQLMLRLRKTHPEATPLISVYTRFLLDAATKKGFHNDRKADGTWEDEGGIGDWFGRAMIALSGTPLFDEKLPLITKVQSFHTVALLLEALCQRPNPMVTSGMISDLASILVDAYKKYSDSTWHWFEDGLTYENARLPEALLLAYTKTGKQEYRDIGLVALDFLVSHTFDEKKGMFTFIGNNGWFHKGRQKAVFAQQPVDAAATVEACCTAYRVTKDTTYKTLAQKAFAWYQGLNIYGACLIDKKTGGVLDGLEESGVSLNEGAESVITYGLAWCAIKDLEKNFPS